MRFSSDAALKIFDVILELYAPARSEELPGRFMGCVRRLLDCEHLSYNEFGPGHFCGILDPVIDDELNERFAALADQHPSIRHINATGEQGAVKISDFVNLRDWKRTELYNEFFRELDISHQLAFLQPEGAIQIGFAANRSRKDFSENDRWILSLLAPHLLQARRNALALERASRAGDAQGGGTVVILNEGEVLYCSPRAREVVNRFFGPILNDRLPDELIRWVKNGLRGPSLEGLSAGSLHPLVKKGENSTLTARLAPNFATGEHVLVVEEQLNQLPISIFTQFGHSKRESEVLAWIAQGKTNPEIAVILDISARTVAHHVERILAKIGVEGRGSAGLWAQEILRRHPMQSAF